MPNCASVRVLLLICLTLNMKFICYININRFVCFPSAPVPPTPTRPPGSSLWPAAPLPPTSSTTSTRTCWRATRAAIRCQRRSSGASRSCRHRCEILREDSFSVFSRWPCFPCFPLHYLALSRYAFYASHHTPITNVVFVRFILVFLFVSRFAVALRFIVCARTSAAAIVVAVVHQHESRC